jgi:hypothetical protein
MELICIPVSFCTNAHENMSCKKGFAIVMYVEQFFSFWWGGGGAASSIQGICYAE